MKRIYTYLLTGMVFLIGLSGCDATTQKEKPPNKLLLISFDGFRYDYLDKVETPKFDQFVEEGVKAKSLIPVFPSETFPNHYSIATGLYPEDTGIVGNTMYDPEWDEWYRISDNKAVQDGKWYGGEPIWNTLEKQDIRTGTMFWVGSEADIQDMRPTYWKSYDGSMPYQARIDTVTKWMTASGDRSVDFATLYFSLVDNAGHRYGPDSDSVKIAIKKADQIVGYLREQLQNAGLWNRLNIIITSDHGMTELSGKKIIEVDDIIDMDNIKREIWGPLAMLQPKEGKEQDVYNTLKKNENHHRVYKKENIPERYHLKNNRRVMDIAMVADLGYTFVQSDYKPRFLESLPGGTHGYDPREKEMHAIFMARGPAFKEDAIVPSFQNVHIYELMNYLMGTSPAPNDGSLDSVRVLLK